MPAPKAEQAALQHASEGQLSKGCRWQLLGATCAADMKLQSSQKSPLQQAMPALVVMTAQAAHLFATCLQKLHADWGQERHLEAVLQVHLPSRHTSLHLLMRLLLGAATTRHAWDASPSPVPCLRLAAGSCSVHQLLAQVGKQLLPCLPAEAWRLGATRSWVGPWLLGCSTSWLMCWAARLQRRATGSWCLSSAWGNGEAGDWKATKSPMGAGNCRAEQRCEVREVYLECGMLQCQVWADQLEP